jgi:sulfite exporter TauE/SafE
MSLLAVLAASLLGSLHCAAMCGPFVLLYAGQRPGPGAWRAHAAYNLARLVSYVGLGAMAGLLGAGLDHAGETLLGVQRAAGVGMGLVLVVMALRAFGVFPKRVKTGAPTGRIARLRLAVLKLRQRPGAATAATVGLLSTLLPCGWLWSFVVLAAASGSALAGAATMATFWAGSVPALVGLGWVVRRFSLHLGRRAPRIAAVAMLAVAGLALAGKLPTAPGAPECPRCAHLHTP